MPSPTDANACFQEIDISGRYRPAHRPRDTFLIPLLERAMAYDRAAGYFSSSSLAAAAEGLEPFAMPWAEGVSGWSSTINCRTMTWLLSSADSG